MARRGPKDKPNSQSLSYGVDTSNDKHYPLPLDSEGTSLRVTDKGSGNVTIKALLNILISEVKLTNLYLEQITGEYYTYKDLT